MQTKLFNSLQYKAAPTAILANIAKDQRLGEVNKKYIFRSESRIFLMHKHFGSSKPKNFCLYLGQNRTYNRKLFISRQAMRKLMKTGLISGLQK
jgi:ribosomal protein S14